MRSGLPQHHSIQLFVLWLCCSLAAAWSLQHQHAFIISIFSMHCLHAVLHAHQHVYNLLTVTCRLLQWMRDHVQQNCIMLWHRMTTIKHPTLSDWLLIQVFLRWLTSSSKMHCTWQASILMAFCCCTLLPCADQIQHLWQVGRFYHAVFHLSICNAIALHFVAVYSGGGVWHTLHWVLNVPCKCRAVGYHAIYTLRSLIAAIKCPCVCNEPA